MSESKILHVAHGPHADRVDMTCGGAYRDWFQVVVPASIADDLAEFARTMVDSEPEPDVRVEDTDHEPSVLSRHDLAEWLIAQPMAPTERATAFLEGQ